LLMGVLGWVWLLALMPFQTLVLFWTRSKDNKFVMAKFVRNIDTFYRYVSFIDIFDICSKKLNILKN
jgi:hypothetical protein